MAAMMQAGLRDWAERDPDRVALKEVPNGRIITFKALESLANRFAHLFRGAGCTRGDHVAVMLGNGVHIFAAVWAAYRAGLYLTPVPTTLSARETIYIVSNCQARLFIADRRYAAAVEALPRAETSVSRFCSLGGTIDGFAELEPQLAILPCTPIADESPGAILLYSSGTTGAPKGIWRPLPDPEQVGGDLPIFARDLVAMFGFRSDERYLSNGPLYHAAPLRFGLAMMAVGASIVVMTKFDADLALTVLMQERITSSIWVPTMFQRMLALPAERRACYAASDHRCAYHGAAPISPAVKRAMIEWWGPILLEYYAGSESLGLCAITSEQWLRKPGSVGPTRKGTAHILDDSFSECAAGVPGRIYFSGVTRFEYFGEPEKTASRTSPQGYQTLGDIGYLDADGYLYLSDRLDDLIISGGVNIYPQELEHAIELAPGVAECGVIGMSDEDFGERPVAFVAPAGGCSDLERLRDELAAHCRKTLARTKQPREIRFVDALPRSEAGKLLRRALRETTGR